MKIYPGKRQRLAGSSGIMDHVMTVVQIVGMAAIIFALKHFTSLPFGTCVLIGCPLFFAIFLGLGYLMMRWRR